MINNYNKNYNLILKDKLKNNKLIQKYKEKLTFIMRYLMSHMLIKD